MNRAAPRLRVDLLPVLMAALGAAVVGVLVVKSPAAAVVFLGLIAVGIATLRYGAFAAAASAFALLPWMVTLEGLMPNQVGTLIASGGTAVLLSMCWPLEFKSRLIPFSAFFFLAVTLGHLALASDKEDFFQAAKYIDFAFVALAITSNRGMPLMPRFKRPVYGSCIAAMGVHLVVILAGLGEVGTYYHAGERLGFTGEAPHPLALMTMVIAAAGLCTSTSLRKGLLFALGAVPSAFTGVRSALLGLAAALLTFLGKSDAKLRAAIVLLVIAAIAFATGALDVLTNRIATQGNEFSSLSSAGSGRGAIWTAALNGWDHAGPWAWVFGTGLRSIPHFELKEVGVELIGHSDIVEVLVQFGVVGFVGWVGIWLGLLRSPANSIILVPILVFGVVNGSLEYVSSLTIGLILAACFADPRRLPDSTGSPPSG
ncbi:MAG: O-antigen ligase family protein [Actinobacteria bacterium]|nr:O-antigen ligase family protein [Actinomycetota bacterium]